MIQDALPLLNTRIGNALFNDAFTKSPNFFSSYFAIEDEGCTTSAAVNDLAAKNGGIRFNSTPVKNHLIAGLTSSNISDEGTFLYNYVSNSLAYEAIDLFFAVFTDIDLDEIAGITSKLTPYAINAITTRYGPYDHWLVNSDLIVPYSSELAGVDPNINSTVTVLYGWDKWHVNITDVDVSGDSVLQLLNLPINNGNIFADNIPANNNPGGTRYKKTSLSDSIKEFTDTSFIKIVSPGQNNNIRIDSMLTVVFNLKDTVNLNKVLMYFQGEVYYSHSKESIQQFSVKVKPEFIDSQLIVVTALYDSSGYRIYHYDIKKIVVQTDNNPINIVVAPKTKVLNLNQQYVPTLNGIHSSYITTIRIDNSELIINVADTNVIQFNSAIHQFIAKDTGSTYAILTYHGLNDSLFFYVLSDYIDTAIPCNPPVANFGASRLSGNCPLNINFFDSSTTTGTTAWLWTFYRGADTITSTLQNPTGIVYNNAGTFAVQLRVTDSCSSIIKTINNFISVTCPTDIIDSNLIAYPNPATGLINVRGYKLENGSYFMVLTDLLGKEVLKTEGVVSNNFIDTQIPLIELPKGVYLLKVDAGDTKKIFKVSKL
jgi:PKD repeat protein